MDELAWTGAIGGAVAAVGAVIAAIGAWRTEVTARWKARVEELRNDKARRENELHRSRFTEIWEWAQAQPEGDRQIEAARWLGQHSGLNYPQQIASGRLPVVTALRKSADEAYQEYIGKLATMGGRLGMGYPLFVPGPATECPQSGHASRITPRSDTAARQAVHLPGEYFYSAAACRRSGSVTA